MAQAMWPDYPRQAGFVPSVRLESVRDDALCSAVEDFIEFARIDANAARLLRSAPASVQRVVMARPLDRARNISAVIVQRIREADLVLSTITTRRSWEPTAGAAGRVQQFIVDNRLDASAAYDLRAAAGYVQEAVLARGRMRDCDNASAAVRTRIRDASREIPPQEEPRRHLALQGAAPRDGPWQGQPGRCVPLSGRSPAEVPLQALGEMALERDAPAPPTRPRHSRSRSRSPSIRRQSSSRSPSRSPSRWSSRSPSHSGKSDTQHAGDWEFIW